MNRRANGWAVDASPAADDAARDARDSTAYYARLVREVVPEFYRRGRRGVPVNWLRGVNRSLRTSGSARRQRSRST